MKKRNTIVLVGNNNDNDNNNNEPFDGYLHYLLLLVARLSIWSANRVSLFFFVGSAEVDDSVIWFFLLVDVVVVAVAVVVVVFVCGGVETDGLAALVVVVAEGWTRPYEPRVFLLTVVAVTSSHLMRPSFSFLYRRFKRSVFVLVLVLVSMFKSKSESKSMDDKTRRVMCEKIDTYETLAHFCLISRLICCCCCYCFAWIEFFSMSNEHFVVFALSC